MPRCRHAVACAVVAACVIAVGCDEDRRSYCEAKIDCEGGTQADLEDCVARMEAMEEIAVGCGCDGQFGDWARCLLEEGSCQTSQWAFDEGVDSGVIWEPIEDGSAVWVTDGVCDSSFGSLIDCETFAGWDPENGGECGG